jgi:hypothetical protein
MNPPAWAGRLPVILKVCFLYVRFPKVFSYHLKTQTSGTLLRSNFAFQLKEAALLKTAHTISFALSISS